MAESGARMRVLVTTPDLSVTGGVSNYFGVLRPFLAGVADYHSVGIRNGEASRLRTLVRLISDYTRFVVTLITAHYDLVHINTAFARRAFPRDAVFCLLARARRRRVIVFVRGGDPGCLQPAWARLFKFAYGGADAFIVLASDHATRLRKFGYLGRIDCETTVASAEAFSAAPARRERSAARFRILFLARLEKEKGIYEAIEAYRVVRQRYEFVDFVIAGDGTETANARQYVREHAIPGVRFLGHVSGDSKTGAYTNSQVYLFTSYFEGMPNSVLEAMAYGLPVITRRVGGITDFFEDGQMGFSTDSNDATVLAGLIERLIADPELAARMGANNRAYAERRFAPPAVAKRLLAIYTGVTGEASIA